MRDCTLDLLLRLLALHLPEPGDNDSAEKHSTVRRIRDQWLLASKGYFMGCVPDGMEDAATLTDGLPVVRQAVDSLMQALEKAPKMLNKGVLNLLGFDERGVLWTGDVETWSLLEVGHAFVGLIEGKITGTARSTEFMPGTRPEAEVNQRLRGWPRSRA